MNHLSVSRLRKDHLHLRSVPRLAGLLLLLGFLTQACIPPALIEIGVPQETELESTGPLKITTAGAVLDARDVDGSITVAADNVTIKRSRVTSGGYYAIRIADGVRGTVIQNVSIACTTAKGSGIGFSHYAASEVDVDGCKNAFLGHDRADVTVLNSTWNDAPVGEQTTPPAPSTTVPPTPTTTVPPAPSTTVPRSALPALTASFPSRDTTGYRSCGRTLAQLTPRSGKITLGDNAVLDNFDLSGEITVTGKNVVIRCGRIRTSAVYGVTATRGGAESYLIEGVEIQGVSSSGGNSAAIAPYGRWTARNLDVWRFRDGIKLGSNHTVEGSWIHDLWKVDGAHNDGMQSVGGRNVVIRGNNIEGPWQASTSALILGAGTVGYLEDYVIEGNRLSGGGYTVYVGGKDGSPTPQNITVRNNTWVKDSAQYGPLSTRLNWPAGDRGVVWSGNTFSDGTPYDR